MIIPTERLILRHWKKSDLKPFAAMNADPNVREYFPNLLTPNESDESVTIYQNEIEEKGFGLWVVELKSNGDFLGMCGLHNVAFQSHFTPCVEIGWRLAASHWGKGYATEAAQESLRFAFEQLNLPEVVAFTATENWRSRRVMEKLSMHRNADDDFDHPKIEHPHPHRKQVLYRILKSEWLNH